MKILVPVDFNFSTEHALRYTDEFTSNLDIEIVLVHALSPRAKEAEVQEKHRELVRLGENII